MYGRETINADVYVRVYACMANGGNARLHAHINVCKHSIVD